MFEVSADDTIVAIITAPSPAAVGIIRLSGSQSLSITHVLFKGKNLLPAPSHTLHYGYIIDPDKNQDLVVDEVVISIYKTPKSYTGEDVVEIACHGSLYILQQVLQLCIQHGARLAEPGEFTRRAFLNGKMDLTQAEAVADLIQSESAAAHQVAMHQMRGGFSAELNALREQLIQFVSLLELELDFAEEDVAFADRSAMLELVKVLLHKTSNLIDSFALGNAIKNGIKVAIIGKPNAGKSTLLNALLNEERAIVSDIAGTTRDTIEERLIINGLLFRLMDTAGIREHSTDVIENMGIVRSKQNAANADIIIHLKDSTEVESEDEWLQAHAQKVVKVWNKCDQVKIEDQTALHISAKGGDGLDQLKSLLYEKATAGHSTNQTLITNARHHDALIKIRESLLAIENGLQSGLSGDLLTIDVRRALHFLGIITGVVEIDRDILGTIFERFCIGK